MNYLAHFQLAWPDEGLLVGALEGDYLKGQLRGELPEDIERGVRLHRAIDAFTDQHPQMSELRRLFRPSLRRYSGILIDLSFDHYLSIHWARYNDLAQSHFNRSVYNTLENHQQHLSPPAHRMFQRMVEHDLLALYSDWETIPATAARIGGRFRRGNPFVDAADDLDAVRLPLEKAFLDFYPELLDYCRHYRQP